MQRNLYYNNPGIEIKTSTITLSTKTTKTIRGKRTMENTPLVELSRRGSTSTPIHIPDSEPEPVGFEWASPLCPFLVQFS